MADSSAAIARWALRAAAPAVQRKAPDTAVDVPQLLLRAKKLGCIHYVFPLNLVL
jgi:hypothetical protein